METATGDGCDEVPPGRERRELAGKLSWAGLILLLLAYVLFLRLNYAPAISHPDANGYWAQGTLIAETGRASFRPESPTQYIGMHWLINSSGEYVSRYSPGLPVVVALIAWLFGPEASLLLNPVLAVATLVGVFLLARSLAGPGWDTLAALALATNPEFNVHALNSISHMAVAALLVWGAYLLVCWSKHGRLLEAFGAGLLWGCIPAIRYPEALFGLGVAAFLLWHWRVRPRIGRHWLVAACGALVPIVPLLIRNQLTFGAFWRTAYALTNEQTGFGWIYFRQHWDQYIQSALSDGVGILLPLALLGITLMMSIPASALKEDERDGRARLIRPFGLLAALLVVPTALLYMAYYWSGMGRGNMRFLLPLFPLLTVTAVWTLRLLTRPLGRTSCFAAVGVILLLHGLWGVPTGWQQCRRLAYEQTVLARTTAALRKQVAPGRVVMAPPWILQHLDFIRAWRLVDPTLAFGGRVSARFQPVDDGTPRPMQPAKRQAQAAKYEGLSGVARERAIAKDIQAWANGGDIYFVGAEDEIRNMTGSYFNPENFKVVAHFDLPKAPLQRNAAGLGGFGRPGGLPQGFGRRQRPGFGGMPGPGFGGMPGPGGGMGMGSLEGQRELVIAKWTPVERRT